MQAHVLAQAYVTLDRLVLHLVQGTPVLRIHYASKIQELRKRGGLADLKSLCEAGAEKEELLWILGGCEGLPGLKTSREVFGWPAGELSKALDALEQTASVIEKTRRYPFGMLVQLAAPFDAEVSDSLRSYAKLARAAQQDFSHGSHWFLNIAKARLVQHVLSHAKGEPHDKEVSGLIAAITESTYNVGTQTRWRQKNDELVRDRLLDPYTLQTPVQREQTSRQLEERIAQDPEFVRVLGQFIASFERLNRARRAAST